MDFDFNVKKLVGEAGSFLTRAVQMTEEVLYSGEKTGLDPQLENLCKQADATRNWTQRIIKDTDAVLVPNPGTRVEDYVLEKIDKKRPSRQNNLECLGSGMIEAAADFGPTTGYGSMLTKVGNTELKLGQIERDFISAASSAFVTPLNKFMDNEMKNVLRERKVLENKRLDLDAAKNKLRKARSMSSTPTKDGSDPRILIQQAEGEVITCQNEFTAQTNVLRKELESMLAVRDRHVENLKAFVASQTNFYERCNQEMMELQQALLSVEDVDDENISGFQKGKVMYDFDATNPDEISVFTNEIIHVQDSSDLEFFLVNKAGKQGKVPKACILLL